MRLVIWDAITLIMTSLLCFKSYFTDIGNFYQNLNIIYFRPFLNRLNAKYFLDKYPFSVCWTPSLLFHRCGQGRSRALNHTQWFKRSHEGWCICLIFCGLHTSITTNCDTYIAGSDWYNRHWQFPVAHIIPAGWLLMNIDSIANSTNV